MDFLDDLLAWSDARQPDYAAACRDPAGAAVSALDLIKEIAEKFQPETSEDCFAAPDGGVLQGTAGHETCTLLALALTAVRQGRWQQARDLLSAVRQGERQDLVLERLWDAAVNERRDPAHPADAWLKDRFCPLPFDQIDTQENQTVHLCPAAWQPLPVGDLGDDPEAAWNSANAQEIRRSILDGDFSHCSRLNCPQINGRRLQSRETYLAPEPASPARERYGKIISGRQIRLETPPFRATFSHDRSCNQSCPSCRTRDIVLGKYDTDRLNRLVSGEYARFLSSARRIVLARDGEPFASRHYLHFLETYCAGSERIRALTLQTSGLLLTEELWNRLDLWGHVSSVRVSVDAATPETYERLRRGGRFSSLLPNLYFLGHLRRLQAIDEFRMDFVVQLDNYAEMPDFVRLSRQVGAGNVQFLRLRNWGTFTEQEFAGRDIGDPIHPDHDQLIQVLRDPVLSGPDVDVSALEAF